VGGEFPDIGAETFGNSARGIEGADERGVFSKLIP
jgi:hypothetical protein